MFHVGHGDNKGPHKDHENVLLLNARSNPTLRSDMVTPNCHAINHSIDFLLLFLTLNPNANAGNQAMI